jgi:hypothetical protein
MDDRPWTMDGPIVGAGPRCLPGSHTTHLPVKPPKPTVGANLVFALFPYHPSSGETTQTHLRGAACRALFPYHPNLAWRTGQGRDPTHN